jgi:hypothetical protein
MLFMYLQLLTIQLSTLMYFEKYMHCSVNAQKSRIKVRNSGQLKDPRILVAALIFFQPMLFIGTNHCFGSCYDNQCFLRKGYKSSGSRGWATKLIWTLPWRRRDIVVSFTPSKFYPNWDFWIENIPSGNLAHHLTDCSYHNKFSSY